MAESPPPGYSGGSILPAPSQPVEMKVFQGGGLTGGTADASMLPQPDHRIPLTEFRGGGVTPQKSGGGKAERTKFQEGLELFKTTEFFNAVSNKTLPNRANVGIYIIDEQGRVCVFRRSDRNKTITAPGGGVDLTDTLNFPDRPAILAALREAKEEVGVNILGIRNFKKLSESELTTLKKEVGNFIPIWNSGPKQGKGGLECYIYLLKRRTTATGADAAHQAEVMLDYDYGEFGTDKNKVLRSVKGVAWVDIQHLVNTLQDPVNSELKDPMYFKFFKILEVIQKGGDASKMDATLPKIPPVTAGRPAAVVSVETNKKVSTSGNDNANTVVSTEDNDTTVSNKSDDNTNTIVSNTDTASTGISIESDDNTNTIVSNTDTASTGISIESDDNNTSTVVSNDTKEAPITQYKSPLVVENGNLVSGENNNNDTTISSTVSKASIRSNATEKTNVEVRKLSNGLVVRLMPEDDSLKADIQALRFTGDEQKLFDDVMNFKHPFIQKFLQKPENTEDFYEFWKLYTTYDGTDQYTLMTYQEGRKIQIFMRKVLEAYRQYLVSAALAFLLKQDKPELLEILQQPPDPEKYSLMETILVPVPPAAPAEEIPPILPQPPASIEQPLDEVSEVELVEPQEKENETVEENEEDEKVVRKQTIFERLNTILQGELPSSRQRKRIFINQKIRGILEILDEEIESKRDYEFIRNSGDITSTSFLKGRTSVEKFILTQVNPDEKLTDFLRDLLKIETNQLEPKVIKQFHAFFLKIINPKSTRDFYEYVFGAEQKETP